MLIIMCASCEDLVFLALIVLAAKLSKQIALVGNHKLMQIVTSYKYYKNCSYSSKI